MIEELPQPEHFSLPSVALFVPEQPNLPRTVLSLALLQYMARQCTLSATVSGRCGASRFAMSLICTSFFEVKTRVNKHDCVGSGLNTHEKRENIDKIAYKRAQQKK